MRLGALALAVFVGWVMLGSPANDVAGWFWSEGPAPWEGVDAFYYPDRSRLSVHEQRLDVGSLDVCRRWAYAAAAAKNDPRLQRGDYECSVGFMRELGDGMKVYRITVR